MRVQRIHFGSGRGGFTITECLVALLVIAVALSLLMSALSATRNTSAKVSCIANLKAIGTAVHHYLADNQFHYPGYGSDISEHTRWHAQLLPYLGHPTTMTWEKRPVVKAPYTFEEFLCPARKLNPEIGGRYGFNTRLQANVSKSTFSLWGVTSTMVVRPAATAMVVDRFRSNITFTIATPFPEGLNGTSANHRKDNQPQNGPNGASNYLFCDGHVEVRMAWEGPNVFELQP